MRKIIYSERENHGIYAVDESESGEAKEENTTAFRPCVVYFSPLILFFVILVAFLLHSRLTGQTVKFPEQEKQSSSPKNHLSLEQIFDGDHQIVSSFPQDKIITLITTGDVLPARTVNYKTVTTNNFNWPYEKTAHILKNADITFINLETPIIENCPLTNDGFKFCADPQNVKGLVFAGVDIANLANNHAGNYGVEGVESTVNFLNESAIIASGVSSPVFKDVKGMRFAFLGYDDTGSGQPGISQAKDEIVLQEISLVTSQSDIVIVAFHWGTEYTSQPTQRQRHLAHLAIDSGADLVIGNHPHWIQPVEIYKDKVIAYSHGNFVFDQMWSQKTKEGVIGRFTFYQDKLIDIEFVPLEIFDFGQPKIAQDDKKDSILTEMEKESLELIKQSTRSKLLTALL